MKADFNIENHGSIALLRPLSTRALEFVETRIDADAQMWGDAVVVEPRNLSEIAEAILAEGMEL